MDRKKQIRTALMGAFVLLCLFTSFAGEAEKNRPFQATFFYPLGTGGMKSLQYSNDVSFNILYGMNGGVGLFEWGGIGNYNHHDVKGLQIAGVANVNRENAKGVILSGVFNGILGDSSGTMASLINLTAGRMQGAQLGLINYATEADGLQLGLINVSARGEDSLPIGLISVVKNGYFAVEAAAGEVLYGNVRYKMGVEQFYTIFQAGASSYEDKPVYGFGMGFGGYIPLSERHRISVEASSSQIFYDNHWDNGVNLLNKADVNYHMSLGQGLSLFAGPSFNVYVSDQTVDGDEGTLPVPYTLSEEVYDDVLVSMWVGGNLGVTYRF